MSDAKGLLDRLRERGGEVFTQLTAELMANRHFMRAMEGAVWGKQKVDAAVGRALKSMNVPSRGEFKKAVARIESLEAEVAALGKTLARQKAAARPAKRKAG
jgi:hypothetical protein